jgi:hypothetical protein
MSNPESTLVEFKYDATFYFDDLPNNQKRVTAAALEETCEETECSLQPQWYRAGKAPVPFQEEVFWAVMVSFL